MLLSGVDLDGGISGLGGEECAAECEVFLARRGEHELVADDVEDAGLREDEGSVEQDLDGEVVVDDHGEGTGVAGEGPLVVADDLFAAAVGEAGGVVVALVDAKFCGAEFDGEAGVGAGEDPLELGLLGYGVREGYRPAEEGGELLVEVGAGDEIGAGPAGADGAVGDEGEGLGYGLGCGGSGGEVDGLLGRVLGLGAGL